MWNKITRQTLLLVALVTSYGCGDDNETPPPGTGLTFWQDIAPIYNAKCEKCHQAGGIAPFALDNYADARTWAAPAAKATRDGIMPPFLVTHDGSCGNFEDGDTLTQAEKDKIFAWASGDLKEGTRVSLIKPRPPGLEGGKELKTPMLAPIAQGGELAAFDEYRCFVVDAGLAKDAFITAYEVLPGNATIVHHVIGFLVDPARKAADGRTNAEVMEQLDASDPDRTGWPCFGTAGEKVTVDAVPLGWAPGQGPVLYPAGMGIRQRTTDKLVVQMHYNLADPKSQGQTDMTTIRLRYADSIERRLVFTLEDGLLDTLYGMKPPALLAPMQPSVEYSWKKTLGEMGLKGVPGVDLMAYMPHMHERGVRSEMRIGDPGQVKACAGRVERWNFHWQKLYPYKGTPTRLTPDSEIEVTCQYDTSTDTAPVSPGWGTRNEMCTIGLMLALPPGV